MLLVPKRIVRLLTLLLHLLHQHHLVLLLGKNLCFVGLLVMDVSFHFVHLVIVVHVLVFFDDIVT